jgi:hypothetical protein
LWDPESRRAERSGELCEGNPILGKSPFLGTFFMKTQGKIQVGWDLNCFLSEGVIPF